MLKNDFIHEKILSELISTIYDAALDPSKWQTFVDALPKALPGLHPVLYLADPKSGLMDTLLVSGNWGSEMVPDYMAHYNGLNPWTAALAKSAPLGHYIRGEQIITTNDLKNSEFYSDFLVNFGEVANVVGTVIHRDETSFGVMGLHGSEKVIDGQDKTLQKFQQLLTPHITRAFEISRKIGHGVALAQTLEMTLEALTSAAILIDANFNVHYANGAAEQLFSNRTLTLDGHKHLTAGSGSQDTKRLREAVTGALLPLTQTPSNTCFKLRAKESLIPLFAQVMPMTKALSGPMKSATSRINRHSKQVLLIISNPQAHNNNLLPLLKIGFGLTHAEAKLAAALAMGDSLSNYAATNGVKVGTARDHLKKIFQKTGTHRQAELVALISQMTSPFKIG